MSEDRSIADHIKGTFAARAARLAAKGPGDDGDKTYDREQYNAIYGILWELCDLFCLQAGTESESSRNVRPDYNENGLIVDNNGTRSYLSGVDAMGAMKRKITWLLGKYVAAYGQPTAEVKKFWTDSVTSAERIAAVARTWDNRTINADFNGDATKVVNYSIDDLDENVGSKLRG